MLSQILPNNQFYFDEKRTIHHINEVFNKKYINYYLYCIMYELICYSLLQLYHQMSKRGSPIKRLDHYSPVRNADSSEILRLMDENQRLNKLVYSKNLEIKTLLQENQIMSATHQQQITQLKLIIKDLQAKTNDYNRIREIELDSIKNRHQKNSEETQILKSYHSHQVEFLLKEIAYLRSENDSKQEKIDLKDHEMKILKESFERQSSELINEISNLKNMMIQIQNGKNRQIRDLSAKRQLQKSRTSGAITSRKQNSNFMDKQLRKLNEQILQKSIKIENLTRQLNKQKKKSQESNKALLKQLQELKTEKEQEMKEKDQHFSKIQKNLKEEILSYKEKEFELLSEIDTIKNTAETLKSELQLQKEQLQNKKNQIVEIKKSLQAQRQEHAKEINSMMLRRKSSKLGSSRSLSSSMKESAVLNVGSASKIQSPRNAQRKNLLLPNLPSVMQQSSPNRDISKQLKQSDIGNEQQQDNQLLRTMYHYQSIIQELKKSHSAQIELLKHKLQKSEKNLEEKQKQLLDILTKFSPLVKIHAQQKTIEEDRKQRIDRHWKSDLALLQIMLQKNKISVFD